MRTIPALKFIPAIFFLKKTVFVFLFSHSGSSKALFAEVEGIQYFLAFQVVVLRFLFVSSYSTCTRSLLPRIVRQNVSHFRQYFNFQFFVRLSCS